MKTKQILIGLFFTLILFFILGYCMKHSEISSVSPEGVRDDLNFQWSNVKALELRVDSLKVIIIKMNSNHIRLQNQLLQHISTQTQLNKEMFRNAQMQLQMNDILSKRIDSK